MNVRRLVRASSLALWAAFFWWLAITGEMTRYLGPRTYWVAWFGAVVLTGAALVHVATLRAGGTARPSAGEVAGLALLLVPVMAVVAVPTPDLGALAAARKTSGIGTLTSSLPKPPAEPGEIGFAEIFYASESAEYATAVGITDGTRVDLMGFVTHPKRGPAGTFSLTRFYVSCCAADAVPYSVAVDADEDLSDDTWLHVKGTLRERDGDFLIEPLSIDKVQTPKNPYLY
jgi:uncharacterized repeat protein (TIGR03943 family)